ncbi:MAG: DNA translocase FtsK [Chloroflexi bacterium]|nr:DNA translocase FtsK [Chloroflexota bacterium]
MAEANAPLRGAGRRRAFWASLGARALANPLLALAIIVSLGAAAALVAVLLGPAVMALVRWVARLLGWGLLLLALWGGYSVLLAKVRPARRLLNKLNLWLSGLAFTAAVWGCLAFFRPPGGLLAEATYGGYLGLAIIGAPDALGGLIVAGLVMAAVVLAAPRRSWRSARWLAPRLWRLYRRYPLHGLPFKALGGALAVGRLVLRRRRREPEETPPAAVAASDTPPSEEAPAAASVPGAAASAAAGHPPAPAAAAPQEAEAKPLRGLARALYALRSEGRPAPPPQRWVLPPLKLLDDIPEAQVSEDDNEKRARAIEEALASYGIEAKVVQINPGPAVTQFGLEPGWVRKFKQVRELGPDGRVRVDKHGRPAVHQEEVSRTRVKVDQILALDKDLALALAASSIRIEAPVPGKSVMGVEVPNPLPDIVSLRSVLEGPPFQKLHGKSRLAVALGKGAGGEPVAADLQKMPHLLIAGATGSGKSVCMNALIASILMFNNPEEVKLLLIDPKRVEMTPYGPIPHLLAPVIVDIAQVTNALKWLNHEMDGRYRKLAALGVRNVEAYNEHPAAERRLPYLIVVIDELADLMMTSPVEVERSICRLAQLSRATGIHLIVATQRPSVDVVTGLIKANFPTRISFAVASQVDSRTILDTPGAESLLGRGDMLYQPQDAAKPLRLQGCFVSDAEIERLADFWAHGQPAATLGTLPVVTTERLDLTAVAPPLPALGDSGPSGQDSDDELLEEAKVIAREHKRLSTSLLQRRLKIGYPRAARLVDLLEEEGVVGPGEPGKSREVLGGRIAAAAASEPSSQDAHGPQP